MESREVVRRAIEFERPPRLPFFQHDVDFAPDDVCDCWEMDRARRGWFFDCAGEDDWGCGWRVTEVGVSHRPRIHGETKYNARNRIWKGLGDTLVVRWMMRNRIAFGSILDVFENPQRDKESSSAANDVKNAEKAPILKR